MNKKQLSESQICDKFIRPAMVAAGWNGMDQLYREFPLRAGRVVVRGQKAQPELALGRVRQPAGRHRPQPGLRSTQAESQGLAGKPEEVQTRGRPMSSIVLLDTSVLLNVLDVQGLDGG